MNEHEIFEALRNDPNMDHDKLLDFISFYKRIVYNDELVEVSDVLRKATRSSDH